MADEAKKEEQQEEKTEEGETQEEVKPQVEEKKETPEVVEEPKAEPQKIEKPAPSGKYADIITQIEALSVKDLSELVKELETRFGVSASMPMSMGVASGAAAPQDGSAGEEEEKTRFSVVLSASGDQKIAVIKAVREIKPDLGLKEAKDLVDGAPKELLTNIKKEDAEEAKKKLEAAGATVEMK